MLQQLIMQLVAVALVAAFLLWVLIFALAWQGGEDIADEIAFAQAWRSDEYATVPAWDSPTQGWLIARHRADVVADDVEHQPRHLAPAEATPIIDGELVNA